MLVKMMQNVKDAVIYAVLLQHFRYLPLELLYNCTFLVDPIYTRYAKVQPDTQLFMSINTYTNVSFAKCLRLCRIDDDCTSSAYSTSMSACQLLECRWVGNSSQLHHNSGLCNFHRCSMKMRDIYLLWHYTVIFHLIVLPYPPASF